MKFSLKITFSSDWHIGDGAGSSGHIDRVVRRHPEDNLPYVPAKTLTGVLRDACEKVALALDDGQETGAWQAFVASLFGQQSKGVASDEVAHTTAALVSFGVARFAADTRRQLVNNADLRAALTFIKPGVAIDAETGVAKSRMLRLEEMVACNSELFAECQLDERIASREDCRNAALAILFAGSRVVERLGAKRRRGHGRCVLSIHSQPGADSLLSCLHSSPPSLTDLQAINAGLRLSNCAVGQTSGVSDWHCITLRLHLKGPVVVPDATYGNVVATRDFIPGSLLLPALDRKLRQVLGEQAENLTSYLAAGHIRILNAYRAHGAERLLPSPAALMAEKESPGRVINELSGHGNDSVQRKQLRGGFVSPRGLYESEENKSPVKHVNTYSVTHSVIDDRFQRPTADVGGVYTYEAIAPGERLQSEVWISKTILPSLSDVSAFNGVIRIGRSKKDDYGCVEISATGVASRTTQQGQAAHMQEFNMWLVSPVLLRDERLRPITDVHSLTVWLQHQLGITGGLRLQKSFTRSMRDDGWSNAWKEPRPSRFGLTSGSCLKFTSETPIESTRLNALEYAGLGERRGEGYGEIRINAPILSAFSLPRLSEGVELGKQTSDAEVSGMPSRDRAFELGLSLRAWEMCVRRESIRRASGFAKQVGLSHGGTKRSGTIPGNSQLGLLRSLFENSTDNKNLCNWLEESTQNTTLRQAKKLEDKWPKVAITELHDWAKNADRIWTLIPAADLPVFEQQDRERVKKMFAWRATQIFWLTVIGKEMDQRSMSDKQPPALKEA